MTRFSFPHLPPVTKNFYIKVWVHTHTRSYMYVYILISQTRKLRLNDFSNITQLFSGKNGDRNKFFYICSVFPFFSFCFVFSITFAVRFLSFFFFLLSGFYPTTVKRMFLGSCLHSGQEGCRKASCWLLTQYPIMSLCFWVGHRQSEDTERGTALHEDTF